MIRDPETGQTGTLRGQEEALQATLVELIDLSLQAKQAHWNVAGPTFKPVHEFLDELTAEYRDWYDLVAERLAAIGCSPDGRIATVAATTPLPALPLGKLVEGDVLASFDQRVTTVAADVRHRAEGAAAPDVATQDVLIEILRGLEKQRWMLRAHRA
jgi:starvation-inducible DNA-binding protein